MRQESLMILSAKPTEHCKHYFQSKFEICPSVDDWTDGGTDDKY